MGAVAVLRRLPLSEPAVAPQALELLLLAICAAPISAGLRGPLREWLRSANFYVEGIKRDSPPGLRLAELPTRTAYDFGAGLLALGVQHLVGCVLCVPAVVGSTLLGSDVAAALVRHVALLEAAFGFVHLADVLYRQFLSDDAQKRLPVSLLAALAGRHAVGIGLGVSLNLCCSVEPSYWLFIFGLKLAGLASTLISPVAWTLDDAYLPDLPALWFISVLDVVASVSSQFALFRGLLGLARTGIREGALLLVASSSAAALTLLPLGISLVAGSLARAASNFGKTRVKED